MPTNPSTIKNIRWCLVSGGSYRHEKISKVEVARAAMEGMKRARLGNQELTVTFLNDDNSFARAYQEEQETRIEHVLPMQVETKASPPPAVRNHPERNLVLIGAFDGIGGARQALHLLGITLAVYISIESNSTSRDVVRRNWVCEHIESMEAATPQRIRAILEKIQKCV